MTGTALVVLLSYPPRFQQWGRWRRGWVTEGVTCIPWLSPNFAKSRVSNIDCFNHISERVEIAQWLDLDRFGFVAPLGFAFANHGNDAHRPGRGSGDQGRVCRGWIVSRWTGLHLGASRIRQQGWSQHLSMDSRAHWHPFRALECLGMPMLKGWLWLYRLCHNRSDHRKVYRMLLNPQLKHILRSVSAVRGNRFCMKGTCPGLVGWQSCHSSISSFTTNIHLLKFESKATKRRERIWKSDNKRTKR